jgi:NADH dehydrogenase [ubiquinone] 1 alpha subcomplex assembly factor 7|tara:strand:- start:582 stop:1646 length:1065 start_codon:yes stop_codon:yes gene_type:complete
MKSINKYFPKSKKIPIDKFIANALYDKNYGYYSKKNSFGKNGDFITAPEISFLFSEMLALWIVSFWEHLDKPKIFNIIELGPGSGRMNSTLISVFKKFPVFFNSTNIFLYEKSESLKKLQKKNLFGERVKWIKNFNNIKNGAVIFLGNEFFDAIPIKQYKKVDNILYEKYVELEDNSRIKTFLKKTNLKTIKKLKKFNLIKDQSLIEFPEQGLKELDLVSSAIKRLSGGLLLIDYGFLVQKSIDTLQSVKNHKKNMLLDNVGDADITSLVNFNLLKIYFKREKLRTNNIVTQEFFLKKMGIVKRAEIVSKKMNFQKKSETFYRLQRLLHPKQMGELFKVIFAFKLKKKFSTGFI